MPLTRAELANTLANPDAARQRLDWLDQREDAEKSLRDFVKLAWHVVEPSEKLVWTWTMDAIVDHLEAVTAGDIRKLLINVPPGFSKSMLVNVLWPAWEWIRRPDLRYISWAYNQTLTIRDNRRCRHVIESDLYQSMWGDRFQLAGDQNAKVRFDTDKMGFRIATSVGGMGTGERGHRNIIDDPHSVQGAESEAEREGALDWFANTLPTRTINGATSAFIGIMQRTNEADVSGHILTHALGWDHLLIEMRYEGADHSVRKAFSLPATTAIGWKDPRPDIIQAVDDYAVANGETVWTQVARHMAMLASPERFPEHVILELEKQMESFGGIYAVAGQLQQAPVSKSGGMFDKAWFTKIIPLSELPQTNAKPARAWDFAGSTKKTSPYTASARGFLHAGAVYITDITCDRWEAADLENRVVDQAEFDGRFVEQDWPQDPGQAGKAQVASMAKRLHGYVVHSSPETGEKSVRAAPFAAQAKRGNVVLVEGAWNAGAVSELALFPRGKFKDRVDAISRLYARLVGQPTVTAPHGGETGIIGDDRTATTPADKAVVNRFALLGGSGN